MHHRSGARSNVHVRTRMFIAAKQLPAKRKLDVVFLVKLDVVFLVKLD